MNNELVTNEKKWSKKEVRKKTNKVARGVLVYEMIISLTVIVYMIRKIAPFFSINDELEMGSIGDKILSDTMNIGTSSIIGIFLGLLFLLFYFRKCDSQKLIFHSQEKMTRLPFLELLTIFMSAQTIVGLFSVGVESCFNRFGLSILGEIESASSSSVTISMFLYASFIGPIAEEIIFRGFVMRGFQKYGTYYAVFMSAVIFGAFHGNLIQSIFATLVGLILGYVAMKYSIKWSIILHIINNFIFGDLLYYLTANLNESMQFIVFNLIQGVFAVGTIAIIIIKRKEIKKFIKNRKIEKGLLGLTFTSVWMLIFLAIQILLGIFGIEKLQV